MSSRRSSKSSKSRRQNKSEPEILYDTDGKRLDTEKKCELLDRYAAAMTKTKKEAGALRWEWADTDTEMLLSHPLAAEVAYRKARKAFCDWFEKKKKRARPQKESKK